MKKLFTFVFSLIIISANAFQDTTAKMPPEETRPSSYWWWIIGVVITFAVGIALYRLIKKDPRKDG
jgi:phosphotransferase system  glucose/maltose/N-acetylglucosamine-specific IIC component